jgi:sugar phosphate isomerase/epimerase
VLAGAASAGFAAVGLDDVSVAAHSSDEVAALLPAHGLLCSDVGVLRVGAEDVRPAAERLAELATAAEADTCIAAVFGDDPLRDLRAAADILAAVGIRLALEHAAYGALRTLADAIALCTAVGWDRCGLLVDSWHFHRGGEPPWWRLRLLDRAQIALVHLNDALPPVGVDEVHESRFRRVPPGRGELDLARFMHELDALGYDGVVSLEVLSAELRNRPPVEGARELLAAAATLQPLGTIRAIR